MKILSVDEARKYIDCFRTHTIPGTHYVETGSRRILLDEMNDDEAVFVASEFQRMEAEAALLRKGPTQ